MCGLGPRKEKRGDGDESDASCNEHAAGAMLMGESE